MSKTQPDLNQACDSTVRRYWLPAAPWWVLRDWRAVPASHDVWGTCLGCLATSDCLLHRGTVQTGSMQCTAVLCLPLAARDKVPRHRHPCTYGAASGRYCYMLCGPPSRHSRSTATSSHLERSTYRQYKVSATREQTPLVLVPGTKPPS